MSEITVFHNPRCSNSRRVLELIRQTGAEPKIIEYLVTPPDHATLAALIAATGKPARELMRQKEAIYKELQLDDSKWTEDELVDFMVAHPVLINRPIVVTPLGTQVCRPPESVLDILQEA